MEAKKHHAEIMATLVAAAAESMAAEEAEMKPRLNIAAQPSRNQHFRPEPADPAPMMTFINQFAVYLASQAVVSQAAHPGAG